MSGSLSHLSPSTPLPKSDLESLLQKLLKLIVRIVASSLTNAACSATPISKTPFTRGGKLINTEGGHRTCVHLSSCTDTVINYQRRDGNRCTWYRKLEAFDLPGQLIGYRHNLNSRAGIRTAEPYIGCPCPCPPMPMGFWVGMGAMLLFMGGHRFCASLHPAPNRSQTSRM